MLVWIDLDDVLICFDRFDYVWICWEVWKCLKTLDRFENVWIGLKMFGKGWKG